MFRAMRRIKQQLSNDECKKILAETGRAVLSVAGDSGYPYCIPINYYYDETENVIYIHGAKDGHKIDAIKKCDKVCFTTWKEIAKIEMGYEVESVVVFGKVSFVNDVKVVEKELWNIGNKYHPNDEYNRSEIERNLNVVQILKIDIEYMTGKHINEF